MERGQGKEVRAGEAAQQEQEHAGRWQSDPQGSHEVHSQTRALLLLAQ